MKIIRRVLHTELKDWALPRHNHVGRRRRRGNGFEEFNVKHACRLSNLTAAERVEYTSRGRPRGTGPVWPIKVFGNLEK